MTQLRDPINGDSASVFAEKIGLPPEYLAAAEPIALRLLAERSGDIARLIDDPKARSAENVHAAAEGIEKDPDLGMLAVGLILCMDAHRLYSGRGIDDGIYYASVRELTVWAKTCERETGHIGFYEWGWLTNFLTASIVRLGRLEFHRVPFRDGEPYEKRGVTAKPGDTVINIHVPEDGPLDPDAVREAFICTYRYFGCSGTAVFVCESWLLWPGNYEFLPESSRIRAFMDLFDIIDREDRKNSGDLWRVFGRRKSYDPASLPRDTALRRAMADYLAAHDSVTGYGYGVALFDGTDFVR
ncbi:MAG: DUF5596 domain-containing protein [Clostridia bacterium]|nr:DUF5596 domain-containing protein [Clostridia bacterium]